MQNWSLRHHVPSADAERSDDLAPSLRTLRSMDDYRFERFVADLRAEMGDRTTVRRASHDGGIDVLARKRGPGGATEAIQAKRYEESTTVGGSVTLAATAYIVARVAGVPEPRRFSVRRWSGWSAWRGAWRSPSDCSRSSAG